MPCQIPICSSIIGFVLELEQVAVSPRTWEPSLLVPLAKSASLKSVSIFVVSCNS